jgi:hypothetical protein
MKLIQVRQEPFDVPSPMWNVTEVGFDYVLERLR